MKKTFALSVVAGALLVAPATAQATGLRIGYTYVNGHKVGYCSWSPKHSKRVHPIVKWSLTHKHTVKGWAQRTPRSVCGINGNTYDGHIPYRPVGPVRARGYWVRRSNTRLPMYGFVGRHIYFGWKSIRLHHAANVMSGKAYLVRHGHAIRYHRQAPWTTPSQFGCGARNTDGWYGCFRSAAVQFRSGRVGFVSISLASMPVAGAILQKMHVVTAVTGDSGGGEEYIAAGHTFQTIPNAGRYAYWRRPIPDAVLLVRSKR